MSRGASHPSSTLAASAAATVLCSAGIAWAAYREGRRRGRNEAGARAKAVDDADATPTSGGDGKRDDGKEVYVNGSTDGNIPPTSSSPSPSAFTSLPIHPVGTLHSIYRLCVGTPRQGMLAPHSRGTIDFDETTVSRDALLELQHYSHVFVVFVFHLNSNAKVLESTFGKNDGTTKDVKRSQRQFPSKIAPPSLGGKKVGVFSTRTPHRPNPIGFSLCRLDEVIVHRDKKKKGDRSKKKGAGTFSLLLSGLDIVDGTPILDVKPYVPHYDCVGYPSMMAPPSSSIGAEATAVTNASDAVRVPHWVDSGLQKRRNVTFLPEAEQFLRNLALPSTEPSTSSESQPALDQLQFYGPHSPWKDSPERAVAYTKQCILELLGVDVRSAWQTKKARRGKFQAERSRRVKEWKEGMPASSESLGASESDIASGAEGGDADTGGNKLCTQQIDNLLVRYTIEEPGSDLRNGIDSKGPVVDERSRGSGAEDVVVVHSISLIS